MPLIITQKGFSVSFGSIDPDKINELPEEIRAAARLISEWEYGKPFFELNTSGSTGVPKRIMLNREKIEFSAQQTANAFNLMPGDTLLCCLGLHYIAGFMMVMRAIVNDCNLLITEQKSNPIDGLSSGIKIDFASFVPIQMEMMMDDANAVKKMNQMKAILIGGAAVSDALEKQIQTLQVAVFHTYSMTETYTHVALRHMNGQTKQDSYYPMPGVSISLDTRGCLVINSFLTDHKPLITNDIGEILQDGSFKLMGRADNVINSGGVKIQLEKIESVCGEIFSELGINLSFFASGIKDEKLGQKLVLVVEGASWSKEMINNFNDQLSIKLGKYEVPKEILFIDKIVLTKTGKIDREGTMKMIRKP